MTLTVIYILLLTAILAMFAFFVSHKKSKKNISKTFSAIKTLRNLIENIPKHRGMTNAYLQGDSSFRNGMETLQKEVSAKLTLLLQQCKALKKDNIIESAEHVNQQWQSLQKNVFSLQAAQSFELHSELIQSIIYLTEDFVEEFELSDAQNAEQYYTIDILFKKIPRLTEALGQARGIGTGVAARQHCDVATRVKLKYLHHQIQHILSRSFQHSQIDNQAIKQGLTQSLEKTQNFMNQLQNELISAQHIKIKSDDYYSRATEAISSNFALFDAIFPDIEKQIQNSHGRSNKLVLFQQIASIGIMALPIVTLIFFV